VGSIAENATDAVAYGTPNGITSVKNARSTASNEAKALIYRRQEASDRAISITAARYHSSNIMK
jgi:hypothetical protein